MFQAKADAMQRERDKLSRTSLSSSNLEDDAASTHLSKAQVKRLSGQRLDQTLTAVSEHPAWASGLGLSDHMAALRPSFVVESGCGKDARMAVLPEFQEAFSYDSEIVKNPDPMPTYRRACCTLHGGICCADRNFGAIAKMVSSFHAQVTKHKLGGSPFIVRLRPSYAEAAGLDAPADNWLLVAAISQRPLNHVLFHLCQSGQQLRCALSSGELKLGTLHRVLRTLLHGVMTQEGLEEFAVKAMGQSNVDRRPRSHTHAFAP